MKKALFLLSLVAAVHVCTAAELAPVAPVINCAELKSVDLSAVTEAPMHITGAIAVNDG